MDVVFNLFTFREHKILYHRNKFPYDITVEIKFQIDKKIPVKFLEIIFKKNKQNYLFSGNLYILMNAAILIFALPYFRRRTIFL